MRKTFIKTLCELANKDERIVLLTGDLGFMVLEPFINQFPDRFFNVGVAEQNLIGVASGLAESGLIPYVYSIAPFAVLRPYEFIRNGPIYHQYQVRIVGVGGGIEYGNDGFSHYGIEDIGVLRIQPGIQVFAPVDYLQAETIFTTTWDLPGPIYYRLSKDGRETIPNLNGEFKINEANVIGDGKDILFCSMGPITLEVLKAIDELKNRGVNCTLAIVSSVNSSPISTLEKILPDFKNVITVEAHYVTGGLGSLICDYVASNNFQCRVKKCGIEVVPNGQIGSQQFLFEKYGISKEALIEKAISMIKS
jgi:transketolase